MRTRARAQSSVTMSHTDAGKMKAALLAVVCAGAVVASPDVEQVHIAQGSFDGMSSVTVSWLSNKSMDSTVVFSDTPTPGSSSKTVSGDPGKQYTFQSAYNPNPYTSGFIHHVTLTGLEPNTRYWYTCGSDDGGFSSQSSFMTVGPALQTKPFTFAVMGDLGQTSNSSQTVGHIVDNDEYTFALLVGDLSYADSAWKPRSADEPCTQTRWDSWGRFVEPLASKMPLMVLPGNHEVEQEGPPPATQTEFLAYNSRFKMPAEASGAHNGSLYYSFEAAGVHFVMLNSYGDYNASGEQYQWLAGDLDAVDRSRTPWIVAAMHAPWYNSNVHHHNEVQEIGMRAAMEDLFHKHSVDLVLAGHVHAYERMHNIYKNQTDPTGPVFVNIGDGGNREGPCLEYLQQPSWSAFREAKFGHGALEVHNATHMRWTWHRIVDPEPTTGDDVWVVKEGGAHNPPVARGEGASTKQYDGYAFL